MTLTPLLLLLLVIIGLYLLQMYVPVIFNLLVIIAVALVLIGAFGYPLALPLR